MVKLRLHRLSPVHLRLRACLRHRRPVVLSTCASSSNPILTLRRGAHRNTRLCHARSSALIGQSFSLFRGMNIGTCPCEKGVSSLDNILSCCCWSEHLASMGRASCCCQVWVQGDSWLKLVRSQTLERKKRSSERSSCCRCAKK